MCTYPHRHDVNDSGSRGRQRKNRSVLHLCEIQSEMEEKGRIRRRRGKRAAALPVLSVLKGNEKTLNRSQLTGLLLRDNQMENEAQKTPPLPNLSSIKLCTHYGRGPDTIILLCRVWAKEELHMHNKCSGALQVYCIVRGADGYTSWSWNLHQNNPFLFRDLKRITN